MFLKISCFNSLFGLTIIFFLLIFHTTLIQSANLSHDGKSTMAHNEHSNLTKNESILITAQQSKNSLHTPILQTKDVQVQYAEGGSQNLAVHPANNTIINTIGSIPILNNMSNTDTKSSLQKIKVEKIEDVKNNVKIETNVNSPIISNAGTIANKTISTIAHIPKPTITRASDEIPNSKTSTITDKKGPVSSVLVNEKHKEPIDTIKEPVYEKSSYKSHPEFVLPVVITILVLPMFGLLGYLAIRRGREAWKNRHYRRMDFLIDGMYND